MWGRRAGAGGREVRPQLRLSLEGEGARRLVLLRKLRAHPLHIPAGLWCADRDGMQSTFLQPMARLLAS